LKKRLYIISRIVLIVIILISILIGALTVFLQTPTGKEKFVSALRTSLESSDTKVSFKKMGGLLPFLWEMQDVRIEMASGDVLKIDLVNFRPYLIRMLEKKLALRSLKARNVEYIPKNPGQKTFIKDDLELPISFYIKNFSIEKLTFPFENEKITLNAKGRLKLERKGEKLFFNTTITRDKFEKSALNLNVKSTRGERVKVLCKVKTKTSAFFEPIITLPIEFSSRARIRLHGSFQAFSDLIFNPENKNDTIEGYLVGDISDIATEKALVKQHLLKKDWFFASSIYLNSDHSFELRKLQVLNQNFDFSGNVYFNKEFGFQEAEFDLDTHNLSHFNPISPVNLDGEIKAKITASSDPTGILLNVAFDSSYLNIDRYPITNVEGDLNGLYQNRLFTGSLTLDSKFYDQLWGANAQFSWQVDDGLTLTDYFLGSGYADASGEMTIGPDGYLKGHSHFRVDNLSMLQTIFPELPFFGGVEGDAILYGENNSQRIDLNTNVYDFFYSEMHFDEAHVDSSIIGKNMSLTSNIYNLFYRGILLNDLTFETSTFEDTWPFQITAFGNWQEPVELSLSGFWKIKDEDYLVDFQSFSGHAFSHSFDLTHPSQFTLREGEMHLTDFDISMSDSILHAKADITPDMSQVTLDLDHFPLDFLSLNPHQLAFSGYTSLSCNFTEKNQKTSGSIHVNLEEAEIFSIADREPFTSSGTFKLEFEDDNALISTKLLVREDENITLDGNFPCSLNFMPFKIEPLYKSKVAGSLQYDATAEDILDFINIGPHRFEADLKCDLSLSGTLGNPLLDGSCTLTHGMYENYYTGTYLEDIETTLFAKEGKLIMEKCEGFDEKKGSLTAKGLFVMDPRSNFPYEVDVSFDDLIVVDIPMVISSADGTLKVKGDRDGALAKGTVSVEHADFSIPEKLPAQVPTLDVTYVNAPSFHEMKPIQTGKRIPYPLEFDIKVMADDNVFIYGRGLSSEWRGDFHIGGTYTDIIPKGNLDLLKGDFTFSGKSFDLIKGALIFTGKSGDAPYLDIAGRTEEKSVSIIASLKGALTGPRLTFRSNPSMPLSAILSYLIFGEDISNVTVFQAAQLAAVASSLSGQGPDIFEFTRKTLGLDRFRVVHTPSSGEKGTRGTALQVGKYLMRGLLVSVSHGADASSGNVSIEIDLKKGFIFQAETIQQQAQGKFTLKWNYNY